MLNSKNIAISIAILFGLFSQLAGAYNLSFLNYSPVRHFTKQDWELARDAARKALNETKDGETVSWKNPQSKHFGSLTPIQTTSQAGVTCRILKIENNAKGMSGSATYQFCQKPDGKWAVRQTAPETADDAKESTQQLE